MATPSTQLAPSHVAQQTQEVLRGLLVELGSPAATIPNLAAAHLERDLGLGSLERVELMLRLGAAFGVHLPDRVVAEANTTADLVQAVLATAGHAEPDLLSPELGAVRRHAEPSPRDAAHVAEGAETLTEVLLRHARATPDRAQIFFREDPSPAPAGSGPLMARTVAITYGQLLEQAGRVAAELRARGLGPGMTAAIMLPTCREFFPTFFGILLAGGIPVPIYPPFRADRIEEYAARQAAILQNAEARILVTFRQAETVARLLKPRVASLESVVNAEKLVESAAPSIAFHAARADEIAFLQYTSGSTGEPKGVMLTHANLLTNIRDILAAVEFSPDDVGVSWLPLYHDMGLIGAWFTLLYFGVPVAILSPLAFLSRPERWLWAIHHHRGTVGAAPNFAYELCVRKIADRDIEGLDLSTWRAALNGAEPVNPETLDRFAERFARYGFRREALMPVYGLAEASLAVTAPPPGRGPLVDRIERAAFEREGRAVPADSSAQAALAFVSAGRPVPSYEVRVVDDAGQDAGERREGQLWFRGPAATRGYYRNPEATAAIQRPGGWIDSGDRAYTAGGEIYITGRVKDIIIKAGRNIYPHEVEEAAGQVDGVRTGCVVAFGLRDEALGTERLVVVAETREREPAARRRIAAAITERVMEVLDMPPDLIELAPPQSIPKTSSGKLRRQETKKLYLAGKLGRRKPPAWVQVARLAAAGGAQAARSGVARALGVVYGIYALAMFGLFLVPAWLLIHAVPRGRAVWRITVWAIKVCLALIGCRVRVEGREHIPREACIFASNHTSYADVLFLLGYLPENYRFVAKMEVSAYPFIRAFIQRMGHFAFDRADQKARLDQVKEVEETLRRGESVFVFPEGTFSPAEGVRSFQLGAFKAAVSTGRPICPVALRGSREILRDETVLPRPGRVTITVCPPLRPQADGWQEIVRLRDATRAAIAAHCGEPLL
jgi:1-acyl-sn-glycerol-3-phosphate acyltransferase